uniref:HMG box domain containing 4a n=1 Tax=Oncorhynchus tshawytscha TaxID=74940 RepID=A0AAZ3PE09_ONCTS
MAFEEIKKKGVVGMEGEVGLVAGRSQREKRRSYKDLLREEEEIAAQDSEPFLLGEDSHKKKKKNTVKTTITEVKEEDWRGSGPPPHKKKRKSSDHSPSLSSCVFLPSHRHSHGSLQAITSPMATGSDRAHTCTSPPTFLPLPPTSPKTANGWEHRRKQKASSSLFHGGTEGLSFPPPPPHPQKGDKKEKDRDRKQLSKVPKKMQSRDPLPVVGKEVEVEGHYGGYGETALLPRGGAEAGELVIDDSYKHLSKKKKKSKKSKKKKEKEKDREKDKGGREKKHTKDQEGHTHTHGSANHSAAGGMYAMGAPIPTPILTHHHQSNEVAMMEKKKKKEEREREKHEKEKDKKKNTTAYQVFCKEYRVNINAEQPGLVFGELSKRLAEVWKQLPEKDKLVWKQKAQYLAQAEQAEATTVKRKSLHRCRKILCSMKGMGLGAGLVSPNRVSVGVSLSPARVPDVDPIDAAAHLQLLGESLSLIGHRLQETEGMVAVSGSLSVLLDSILCALGPLTCLTAQIPQLNGCPRQVLSNTLDNIAYIMPGL